MPGIIIDSPGRTIIILESDELSFYKTNCDKLELLKKKVQNTLYWNTLRLL